ncbi:SDR family oxidoreductase [Membranicola marinus]|uniref:SDR family oxidoreductase n=1 Tax=Membranihabitans marinus TaxID=1227546 RepID=A0A953LA00_9BACT|nr:SDR family oxidoreductase [Membranihabitans marinus]MBY5957146.1 SDR family oxidoreductase [Membranihabitans marinus]
MRLQDKVVLVTGSTTGIGKAIARKCVEEGARVIVHGRDKSSGEDVVKELGVNKTLLVLDDLSDGASARRIIDQSVNHFGKLDIIVNNAAFVASSNIDTTDASLLNDVFSVNTFTPFLLIKEALEQLSENRGAVLNIGSVNAWAGEPNLLAYSMSKGAMMTMTRNLGDALFREHGVRVNQINPGWILTEKEIERKRSHGMSDDWYKELPSMYAPAGRIIWPEEIANSVIYWISDECGPITGQVVELEQYPMIGRNAPKDDI